MLKITITREFNSVEEAALFIGAMDAERYAAVHPLVTAPRGPLVVDGLEHGEQPKRPRKPRNDAGQPRGAYKPRGAAEPAAPATIAKPEGGDAPVADTPASVADAPLAAPSGAASPSAAPVKSSAVEPPQAAQAPAAADLTIEKVRETMGLLNAAKGRGMEACILSLREFGVTRISDLPAAKYAEFDKYLRDQLPKGA